MSLVSPLESETIVELLRRRADEQPDRLAYTHLGEGEHNGGELTYGRLEREVRAVSAALQARLKPGDRALLLYPSGLDFIVSYLACLFAGVVAVPAYPPLNARGIGRLQAIADDARAEAILTTHAQLSKLATSFFRPEGGAALPCLATDRVPTGLAEYWDEPALDGRSLAFLQYTSGSTSTPKGVMVSHRNLLTNSAIIRHGFGLSERSVGVSWLPVFHDMGLIDGILQPLYSGFPTYLMSPVPFLQRPVRWLQAISRFRGTHSGGPNFAYDLCVDKIPPEVRTQLDLSSWETAYNGAEPVRAETLRRFSEAFRSSGFQARYHYPCYGLAEGTLMVTGGETQAEPSILVVDGKALEQGLAVPCPDDRPEARALVSSGKTWLENRVVIARPESQTRAAPHEVGEIWVSGPTVAGGYWQRPEATAETFQAYLADTGEGPFLRTGDLGFLRDGELFVTGRLKDLIILRGKNHYPQDIERTVEQVHPVLRAGCLAAFAVETPQGDGLVIVAEVERRRKGDRLDAKGFEAMIERFDTFSSVPDETRPEELPAAIARAVGLHHDLAVHDVVLIRASTIPKTSSGKIQRRACRDAYQEGRLEVVARLEAEVPLPSRPISQADPATRPSLTGLQAWFVDRLARTFGLAPEQVDLRRPFAAYGLDSARAIEMLGDLSDWLGREVSPTAAWEHPTIESLAAHLAEVSHRTLASVAPGRSLDEPIAIIGVGCRFPGARGPEAFWRLLKDGVDAISEVPADRWEADAYYAADPQVPGKLCTRWGGFLPSVDQFDPDFFGISRREAARMDPQQRLWLEVAYEALEDAGLAPQALAGSRTGVFVGMASYDYSQRALGDPHAVDAFTSTGSALSVTANRLSYLLDLRGPSMVIDTACSSSLVALHQAVRSLRDGESAVAVVGGVNVLLSPALGVSFTKARVMAPDGRCKTFDARADGYVRAEGAGALVLKPLSKAQADGDPIYALVLGTAVNQDGRSNGLMAPNPQAQEAVLQEAYDRAGVSPGRIQYVEAHGTGTALGDPIEAKSLGAVLGRDRPDGSPCAIGSVKTNIGHLEAAAGVAGLVKVALSLCHRWLPASLHFQSPNPLIPFDRLPLTVQSTGAPWPVPAEGPRLAGVSGFGFGGTNAHAVLAEPPANPERPPCRDWPRVIPISAHRPEAMRQLARGYLDLLASDDAPRPDDLVVTATLRRAHHDHRAALVFRDFAELRERLTALAQGRETPGLKTGHRTGQRPPGLAFVFPGQGGQWLGMARRLIDREPVFRNTLERCDHAFLPYVDWSLARQLRQLDAEDRLGEMGVLQPALFAIQVALSALWRSWGVEPDMVVGHSMGEVAAAHVAGILSLDDAARIICERSRLLGQLSGLGAMAVVELSFEEAQEAIASHGGRLSVGVSNGPRSSVLSGDPAALAAVTEALQARGVFCQPVKVDVASHSAQVDPLLDELAPFLTDLSPRSALVPFYSTVSAGREDGSGCHGPYWAANLREPVRFHRTVEAMIADGARLFLEIGPHPVLGVPLAEILADRSVSGLCAPSMRRDEDEHLVMLESLGALYTRGYPVDWPRAQGSDGLATRLPLYPWQWERCWLDVVPQAISRAIAPVDLPPVAEPVPAAEGPGQTLRGLDPERRRIRLDALLREQLAAVLGGDPDRIDPTRPLPELGLQSMMAVELRNRLEGLLDLKLSATLVWSYPTLEAISGHLADRLGTPSTPSVSLAPSDAVRALEAELDSLGAVVTPPLAGNAEELLLAELEALEKGTTR